MRFSALALLLAPVLAKGDAVPDNDRAVDAPVSGSSSTDSTTFDLFCPDDDETFTFDINAFDLGRVDDASCGPSQLVLAGRALQRDWRPTSDFDRSGVSGPSAITVHSAVDGQIHTVDLSASSTCLTGALTADLGRHFVDDHLLEVTTILVDRIDGRDSRSRAGFNVLLDQKTGRILKAIPASADDLMRLSYTHALHGQHEDAHNDNEKEHLAALQLQFEQFLPVLDEDSTNTKGGCKKHPHLGSKCKCVACVLTAVLENAKKHFQLIAQKLPSISGSTSKCSRGQTMFGSIFDGSRGSCQPAKGQALPSSISNVETIKNWRTHAVESAQGKDRSDRVRDYLVLPIAVLATVICFTALTFRLCRTCCSPRAKADWAARCEEIRNRRQYRRLQRQYAISQWWNRIIGRPTTPSSSDYDEKRRLIISQEEILEDAMQNELRLLRLEAGMTPEEIRAAEQDGTGSVTETLPPYNPQRSEASPPSYRTEPSDTGSARHSRSGIRSGSVTPVSDVSSDSSVANLSPRHSSETLRTDGSLV